MDTRTTFDDNNTAIGIPKSRLLKSSPYSDKYIEVQNKFVK